MPLRPRRLRDTGPILMLVGVFVTASASIAVAVIDRPTGPAVVKDTSSPTPPVGLSDPCQAAMPRTMSTFHVGAARNLAQPGVDDFAVKTCYWVTLNDGAPRSYNFLGLTYTTDPRPVSGNGTRYTWLG
jgi:hypothetical protein